MADEATAAQLPSNPQVNFGFDQLGCKTPDWANWIFRSYFIFSKAAVGYVSGLAAVKGLNISTTELAVIMLTMSFLDLLMYGFSKMFGIQPPTDSIETLKS